MKKMQMSGFAVIVLAVVACPSVVSAQDEAQDELVVAKKYVQYWQPIVGDWAVEFEIAGTPAPGKITWRFRKSPTGLCYLATITVNGDVTGHGIHSYDPEHKCWRIEGVRLPGPVDNTLLDTAWLHVDLSKSTHLKEGTTFTTKGRQVAADGTVTEIQNRWTFAIAGPDQFEIKLSDGKANGEPIPDAKMVLNRVSQ